MKFGAANLKQRTVVTSRDMLTSSICEKDNLGSMVNTLAISQVKEDVWQLLTFMAFMASTKLGEAATFTSLSKGPVAGAADGRSSTPTATASVMTAPRIDVTPTQPSQEILSRV